MNQSVQSTFQKIQTGDATFQVVLNGVLPNVSRIDVREKLAVLFKATPEQIDKLLATPVYVVKRAISFDVAAKYKNAIEAAGGVCELVPEEAPTISLDVDLPNEMTLTAGEKKTVSDEIILFQGDATLLKSALNIVQGNATGTAQKFVFSGDKKGDIILRRADIQSAEEIKHGFGTKWVVKTNTGETYQFAAVNMAALRQTMLMLTGQEALAQTTKEPTLSSVRNLTAWLAAFSPWLSGLLVIMIGAVLGWNWDNATTLQLLKAWLFIKLPLIYMFVRIDHLMLQRRGFNTVKLGIVAPGNIFMYLFSRAKAFGHGKGYAITFCVTFGIDVLLAIFG